MVSGHSSKTRHEEIEELQTYRKHVYSRANRSSEESDESDEVMEGQMSVDDILAAAMASICNPEIGGVISGYKNGRHFALTAAFV